MKKHVLILSTFGPLLKRLSFLAMLLFFGHMLLLFENHNLIFFERSRSRFDSPSMGFRGQRPPAGQDFEKWHLFFNLDDFCEFGTSQVWYSGGSGLQQVRILKKDMSFSILMISVSF